MHQLLITRSLLRFCIITGIFFFSLATVSAQTVIGGDTIDQSAVLDIQDTARGVLLPRLTTTQRDAISKPAKGLLLFNTTENAIQINEGTPQTPIWAKLSQLPRNGNQTGNILYWNGNDWVSLSPGLPGQVIALSQSGVPIWSGPALASPTTDSASSISPTSAILGGRITSDGGATVTERGIVWDTNSNPTLSSRVLNLGSGLGTFSGMVSGLSPITLYYFRTYATNSAGTAYGTLQSFTTQPVGLPTLSTKLIISVNETGAISGGNITDDGGAAVTQRGVVFSTTPNPTLSNTVIQAGNGVGDFTSNLTNLSQNTSYYVRAFATNSAGTAYGNELIFKTCASTPILSGTQNICKGSNTIFSTTLAGGTWSSSNTEVATVNISTGAVTGIAAGVAAITYTFSNQGDCPEVSATLNVTIIADQTADTASITPTICISQTLPTIVHTTTGANNIGIPTGLPSGVSATWNSNTITISGTPMETGTFSYIIPLIGGCGTGNASGTFTVNPLSVLAPPPNAGIISGPETICVGTTVQLNSSGQPDGSWSSSNSAIVTVNPFSGHVIGVAAGSATISYTVTGVGGCANVSSTFSILGVELPNPGVLSGIKDICMGGTTALSSSVKGGSWSSNNSTVAIVNPATGVVTGISVGTATVTYTVTDPGGCTNTTTANITVTEAFSCGCDVVDIDGNIYKTVQIGSQCWMQSNLKVSKYRNGESIPSNLDNTTWRQTVSGSYSIYNNDPVNDSIYGKLYNWYAVNDSRGLCPSGWKVPTDEEWYTLTLSTLGGANVAGTKMKVTGTTFWNSPNTGTNSSGFSALPGGIRLGNDGKFLYQKGYGFFWTSTGFGSSYAWYRNLFANVGNVFANYNNKNDGYSVRCMKQ